MRGEGDARNGAAQGGTGAPRKEALYRVTK